MQVDTHTPTSGRNPTPLSLTGICLLAVAMFLTGCASQMTSSVVSSSSLPSHSAAHANDAQNGYTPPGYIPVEQAARVPDAEPRIEPIRDDGPNRPYVIKHQAYTPRVGDIAWRERGQASWYGKQFNGRLTASGETYSMYAMTAAHKTLPIPSYARVRNLANGREIIVKINDRGPFHSKRVLDLSYSAAAKLGIVSSGHGNVEIERVTNEEIRAMQQADDKVAQNTPAPESAAQLAPPQQVAQAPTTALPSTPTARAGAHLLANIDTSASWALHTKHGLFAHQSSFNASYTPASFASAPWALSNGFSPAVATAIAP